VILLLPDYLGLPKIAWQEITNPDNSVDYHHFIYSPYGLVSQRSSKANQAAQEYYFHYDYRGSVVAISDRNGDVVARYGYTPFGTRFDAPEFAEQNKAITTPFGYNGRDGVITDSNGFIYMRARYYSPELRRFVSKDPIRGDIGDLGSLNRYAYVGGDPVNLVDPSGLCASTGAGTTVGGECVSHGGGVNPESPLDPYFDAIASGLLFGELDLSQAAAMCAEEGNCLALGVGSFAQACYNTAEGLGYLLLGKEGFKLSTAYLLKNASNKSVWSLSATARGSSIESTLAKSEYKNWYNVGNSQNGYFPLIDFQKGNNLVSLKTVDTTGSSWMGRMKSHIDDLATRGATVDNQKANMILDLRVQPGGATDASSLIQYGRQQGINVVIKEF